MSPAVTSAGPSTSSSMIFRLQRTISLQFPLVFRMICITSSRTPGTVSNSCNTPSILIDVTAAPGREARSTRRESYQELYRSHVQWSRLQTCHNLYFHQFLLYLVFQTRSFSYSLLNEKQCNAMIIHGDVFGGRAPYCGTGVTSRIAVTSRPAAASARIADSDQNLDLLQ